MYEPELIDDWLLQSIKLGKSKCKNNLNKFWKILQKQSIENPYLTVILTSDKTYGKIVNCLYSKSQNQNKIWTEKEIKLINDFLLKNNEKDI